MIRQLRVYKINPDLKAEFDKRFREHALRIMQSYDFKIASMWYSDFEGNTEFLYILEWPNEVVMRSKWEAFMADTEWDDIKKQSRERYGEMVLGKLRDQILADTTWFNNSIR